MHSEMHSLKDRQTEVTVWRKTFLQFAGEIKPDSCVNLFHQGLGTVLSLLFKLD